LELIRATQLGEFPPRLPEQPIFDPALTADYATPDGAPREHRDERSGFAGDRLRFRVPAAFLRKYDGQVVGSSGHREYWIPAQDLTRLKTSKGTIEGVAEF
jgi:hypothetical protein